MKFVVSAEDDRRRADVVLASLLSVSRREAQRLLAEGAIRVNGRPVSKGDLLGAGERVEVALGESGALASDPQVAIEVIHVDDALIVVDKPAPMATHPLRLGERGTVANALLARFPELASIGPRHEAGAAHRLDVTTSGLLCFGRTEEAYAALRTAFRRGEVRKGYLALCLGEPPDRGVCDLPIGHAGRRSPRARVDTGAQAATRRGTLPARTVFEVMKRYSRAALVEVEAKTGRMHQIRVHLAHLGFPLAGDRLYQNARQRAGDPTSLARPFLHASSLSLPHPTTGQLVSFDCALPRDLQTCLEALSAGERG